MMWLHRVRKEPLVSGIPAEVFRDFCGGLIVGAVCGFAWGWTYVGAGGGQLGASISWAVVGSGAGFLLACLHDVIWRGRLEDLDHAVLEDSEPMGAELSTLPTASMLLPEKKAS